MNRVISKCPSCSSDDLKITRIECCQCETRFEGKFTVPILLQLDSNDLSFILDFVRCSGSLKEMATKLDISYPTVRNRLNAVIDRLEELKGEEKKIKDQILYLLEQGVLTAQEAAARLREVRS